MCGIAGFFGHPDATLPPAALLARMINMVSHRGPDGQGVHCDVGVGLAHARLSIIDLTSGHQPMSNGDGSFWISFNGEIFNYLELRRDLGARGFRFRTNSDTEVILACYEYFGLDFVKYLNGDFAIALWDKSRERLVLARDRMGVRPLYYKEEGDCLYFSSAIKGLLAVPGLRTEPDPVALSQVFTLWCPLAPRTFFKDILELPPAHMLVATREKITVSSYWQVTFPETDFREESADDSEASDEIHALLSDATRIRLRSDVPVGSYLSGGLDSSIVTAIAQQIAPSRLKTFSVAFEHPEYDEAQYQQIMADVLGTDHNSALCRTNDIGESFPDVMSHIEQPILRTAPAPLFMLSKLVRDSGLKVVLTGEGADEVFGGYDIFKEAKLRRFCARQPGSRIRPLLLRRLYPYLPRLQGQSQRYLEAFFGQDADCTDDPLFSHLPRFRASPAINSFLAPDLRHQIGDYDPLDDLRGRLPPEFTRWHPLAQAQYLEMTYLLPGYILSAQGDRMAMGHGVEGRFPFLDYRVVERAARLPAGMKLKGLREKHILRTSFKNHLPRNIAERPKQPYRAPDAQCFIGANAPSYVGDRLAPEAVQAAGLFNPATVQKLVQKASRQGLTSFRDNMAFVGILSTQLLHHAFFEGEAERPSLPSSFMLAG